MEMWCNLLLMLFILVASIALCFVHNINKRTKINTILDKASIESEFNATIFQIYDRSTPKQCDRLIRIRPFDWYVWAVCGELYILNPEGVTQCGPGSTPAIQVFAEQFAEKCLSLNYDSILNPYIRLPAKHIDYSIGDTKTFTILSALNILVKKWITFNTEQFDLTQGRARKRWSVGEITSSMMLDSMKNSRYSKSQLAN
uniref:PIF-4 n=1 Tax=Nilaparvata lugens endogenous nudivirus TaxID=1487700 RepID=X5GF20_9VIRU|nr:PIF-4 [Nilaparvata lugens endogenous nudivirus]